MSGTYLLLIALCLFVQAFFSMSEMSIVSFNKVRLQYYVSQNSRRARWLSYLLAHPTRLFGATLIGACTMVQLGSELARRFFVSIGMSAEWAALFETLVVLLFAELSPMFAARRYAEHVAMLFAPVIFTVSIVMTPIIWVFNAVCAVMHKVLGTAGPTENYLTREELQKAIEEREEGEESAFDRVVHNIFAMQQKQVSELAKPFDKLAMISSETTVGELRKQLMVHHTPFAPVYHRSEANIVGIAYPKRLIRAADGEKVRPLAAQPWFISGQSTVAEVLGQFRHKGQNVAIVLDELGTALGVLCLDDVIGDLFAIDIEKVPDAQPMLVERTFPARTTITDINRKLGTTLDAKESDTLEELMIHRLGHRPNRGETVRCGIYELAMLEAGIFRGKRVRIRSIR